MTGINHRGQYATLFPEPHCEYSWLLYDPANLKAIPSPLTSCCSLTR